MRVGEILVASREGGKNSVRNRYMSYSLSP